MPKKSKNLSYKRNKRKMKKANVRMNSKMLLKNRSMSRMKKANKKLNNHTMCPLIWKS